MYRLKEGDEILINCSDGRCKEKKGIIESIEYSSGFQGYRLKSGTWIYEEWAMLMPNLTI